MDRKIKLLLVILLGVLIILIIVGAVNKFTGKVVYTEPIFVTEENFPAYIESYGISKVVSKNAKINMQIGEKSYSISGNAVGEGKLDDAEIFLEIPARYFGKEYSGICGFLNAAVRGEDFRFETSLSKTELLLKYKGLLKYKKCFG